MKLFALLSAALVYGYQGPDFRKQYYRSKWLSNDFTHEVTFTIKRGGFNGVGNNGEGPTETVEDIGTITLGLYGYIVPATVRNFCEIAAGFEVDDKSYSYANTKFHRVISQFMIQGGDVVRGDGRGAFSIYGDRFPDERFTLKHDRPGLLSMANSGPNSNGSQFFITTIPTGWLDDKHVVFGAVADEASMEVVKKIDGTRVNGQSPIPEVWISASSCKFVDYEE